MFEEMTELEHENGFESFVVVVVVVVVVVEEK